MLHKQLIKSKKGLVWIPYLEREKGLWWENTGCILNHKGSLTQNDLYDAICMNRLI